MVGAKPFEGRYCYRLRLTVLVPLYDERGEPGSGRVWVCRGRVSCRRHGYQPIPEKNAREIESSTGTL